MADDIVDPIWISRATAIEAYAHLEQALCRLFSFVGDMPTDVAGIVFFKIVSTQARSAILDKLFKRKFKGQFNLFLNSIVKSMKPIDERRNEIIHWNIVVNTDTDQDGNFVETISLRPPTFWVTGQMQNTLTNADLVAFNIKCRFYARVINFFTMVRTGKHQALGDALDSWRDIFLQPLTYPPPAGTLLYKTLQEL